MWALWVILSHLLDTIFENETIRKYFSPETYHVIDYHQEFDEGIDAEKFPDYNSQVARFFNTDCNTTTGYYKMGDVETGATMTLEVGYWLSSVQNNAIRQ